MATFKEIRGQLIKKYTTNPTDPLEGQMWYNNTTGTLKGNIVSEAWSSVTSLPVERGIGGGCGSTTAALQCGGLGTPPATVATTFEYNGAGWSAGGDLPGVRRNNSVFGTQTAAVSAGNLPAANNVDLYDGASWTTGTVYPAVALDLGVAGTQTAGVAWGGNQDPGLLSTTNEYNGSWTASGAYPAGSSASGSLGTQTAAVSIGGLAPTKVDTTFEYDGASWAAGGTYPISVSHTGGAGTQTAGLGFAGYLVPGVTGVTNSYDGTTWTASATMGTARYQMTQGLGATNTDALAVGGQTPPRVATVEEYNRSASVLTPATWASGTAVNTGRYNAYSCADGPPSALLFFGGITGVPGNSTNTAKTEEFNGTAWSEEADMPAAISAGGAGGTQTAAIAMGGYESGTLSALTSEYNGAAWAALTALPTATANTKGCGTSTAALYVGGKTAAAPGGETDTWEYTAPAWTAGVSMSTIRWQPGVFGTQTAAVAAGGRNPPSSPFMTTTEEFNGLAWSSGGDLLTASGYLSSSGGQTDGLVYAGESTPAKLSQCVGYDGTAFSTRPSIATARAAPGEGGGTTSATAVCISGDTPQTPSAMNTAVEEFTAETTSANIVTVTTS